jgi:hypothetical protein
LGADGELDLLTEGALGGAWFANRDEPASIMLSINIERGVIFFIELSLGEFFAGSSMLKAESASALPAEDLEQILIAGRLVKNSKR